MQFPVETNLTALQIQNRSLWNPTSALSLIIRQQMQLNCEIILMEYIKVEDLITVNITIKEHLESEDT